MSVWWWFVWLALAVVAVFRLCFWLFVFGMFGLYLIVCICVVVCWFDKWCFAALSLLVVVVVIACIGC